MSAKRGRRWWAIDSQYRKILSDHLEAAEERIYHALMDATTMAEIEQDVTEAINRLRRVQDRVRKEQQKGKP